MRGHSKRTCVQGSNNLRAAAGACFANLAGEEVVYCHGKMSVTLGELHGLQGGIVSTNVRPTKLTTQCHPKKE